MAWLLFLSHSPISTTPILLWSVTPQELHEVNRVQSQFFGWKARCRVPIYHDQQPANKWSIHLCQCTSRPIQTTWTSARPLTWAVGEGFCNNSSRNWSASEQCYHSEYEYPKVYDSLLQNLLFSDYCYLSLIICFFFQEMIIKNDGEGPKGRYGSMEMPQSESWHSAYPILWWVNLISSIKISWLSAPPLLFLLSICD